MLHCPMLNTLGDSPPLGFDISKNLVVFIRLIQRSSGGPRAAGSLYRRVKPRVAIEAAPPHSSIDATGASVVLRRCDRMDRLRRRIAEGAVRRGGSGGRKSMRASGMKGAWAAVLAAVVS